jgi:hypothetical protein
MEGLLVDRHQGRQLVSADPPRRSAAIRTRRSTRIMAVAPPGGKSEAERAAARLGPGAFLLEA